MKIDKEFSDVNDEDNEENNIRQPMEGNLWIIQCKREKQITPAKIKSILTDINPDNPPYGYILAAAANFSKKIYDTFREQLQKFLYGYLDFYINKYAIIHPFENNMEVIC